MKKSNVSAWLAVSCLVGLLLSAAGICAPAASASAKATPASGGAVQRVSRFGEYRGYSKILYNSWVTTSRYVTMPDGTRIAVDISRPAVNGVVTDKPYPVLLTTSRYHRRWGPEPSIDSSPVLQFLLKHGYVIAASQVRGGGASFGRYQGLFSKAETEDAYHLIEWFSKQPWCDGKVGMYGASYLGITQYMVASLHPPALKAIFPRVAYYDFYDAVYPGGIYRNTLVNEWSALTFGLDTDRKTIVPVETDPTGKLLDEAIAQHMDNFNPVTELSAAPYRGSTTPQLSWERDTPSMVMAKINSSGIPIYMWSGWFDTYTMDTMEFYVNYTGPHKLVIGPWAHSPVTKAGRKQSNHLLAIESLRWYDRWLKGIKNHVMDGPPINYAVIEKPEKKWIWTSTYSLKSAKRTNYYFGPPRYHSYLVPHDKGLGTRRPTTMIAYKYAVNPATSTGWATRWSESVGGPRMDYPEMSPNDRLSLTFTTPPLRKAVRVIGIPIVTLYAASSATDSDFYALLEDVYPDGASHYVSEGLLRASDRKLAKPPWKMLGAPWHPGFKADRKPLVPGKVVKLKFFIIPTSFQFNSGNRIRIVIMGADRAQTVPPPHIHAILTIMTGGDQASRVSLPLAKPLGTK